MESIPAAFNESGGRRIEQRVSGGGVAEIRTRSVKGELSSAHLPKTPGLQVVSKFIAGLGLPPVYCRSRAHRIKNEIHTTRIDLEFDMTLRFQVLPATQSGNFYQLRDSNNYQQEVVNQISIFRDRSGRLFRDSAMPFAVGQGVIGCAAPLESDQSAVAMAAEQILQGVLQRSCEGGACQIISPELELVNQAFLRISGRALNTGRSAWIGWGAGPDFCDSIGVRCFDNTGKLLGEKRIAFPYECVAPGGSVYFQDVFPLHHLNISQGIHSLAIDLVREGVAWYAPEGQGLRLPLTVDFQPLTAELEYSRVSNAGRRVALTFDGGSSAACCAEMLSVLRKHQLRCTLFLTGAFIKRFPELVLMMVRDGHEMANHTLSHPRLCFDRDPVPCEGVTQSFLCRELAEADRLFRDLTGENFVPLWRAPFGHRNSMTLLWGELAGYRHIFWDFDSEDWRVGVGEAPQLTAEQAGVRALDFVQQEVAGLGNIMLFHLAAGSRTDPFYPWIDRIIEECHRRSIELTTVSALLKGS